MENGNTKDDLRLPTDDSLLTQVSMHVMVVSDFYLFAVLKVTNSS